MELPGYDPVGSVAFLRLIGGNAACYATGSETNTLIPDQSYPAINPNKFEFPRSKQKLLANFPQSYQPASFHYAKPLICLGCRTILHVNAYIKSPPEYVGQQRGDPIEFQASNRSSTARGVRHDLLAKRP